VNRLSISVLVALVAAVGSSELSADGSFEVGRSQKTGDVWLRSAGPDPERRFELVFSRQAGGIVEWYDVDRDPQRTRNLAGHGGLVSTVLLTHIIWPQNNERSEALYSAPARKLTLLENNAVRVRLLLEGDYSTQEDAEQWQPVPETRKRRSPTATHFSTTYTIYPTGRLYVSHTLSRETTTLRLGRSEWALANAPGSQFRPMGSLKRGHPGALTSFLLHSSSGPDYFGDALLVPHQRFCFVGRWGQSFMLGSAGTGAVIGSLETHKPGTIIGVEGSPSHCLLQLEPDWIDDASLARMTAETYRNPPPMEAEEGWGEIERGVGGDDDLDGFDEAQGCYSVKAGPGGFRGWLDLPKLALRTPVFRVSNWTGRVPETITVGGKTWQRGRQFEAALVNQTTLLIQSYKTLLGEHLVVEFPTGFRLSDQRKSSRSGSASPPLVKNASP